MKPKILLVTKFYYRRGGDCVAAMNLERLLRDNGHEVAVFAMDYPDNVDSPWRSYWPSEVSFSGGAKAKLAAVGRTLGRGEVAGKFKRLLDDFRPDVVHLHNIHSYLSPVVGALAHKRGIKVVWTLHDYKLLCPGYSCLRRGEVCELCFHDKKKVLTERCMKGSLAASAIAWIEALRWNRRRLQRDTDMFICPSRFMASKMEQGGFDASKLATVTNFVDPGLHEAFSTAGASDGKGGYYCYVGRLSAEKGVATLMKAAASLSYKLKVAGDGPLADELRSRYADSPSIEFLGHLDGAGVRSLLAGARFSVLPSEWYENNPLGVIESLCAGVPVVGSQMGGIPELITDGRGLTYPAGDDRALAEAIEKAWNADFDRDAIRRDALREFSPATHYDRLMEIYSR